MESSCTVTIYRRNTRLGTIRERKKTMNSFDKVQKVERQPAYWVWVPSNNVNILYILLKASKEAQRSSNTLQFQVPKKITTSWLLVIYLLKLDYLFSNDCCISTKTEVWMLHYSHNEKNTIINFYFDCQNHNSLEFFVATHRATTHSLDKHCSRDLCRTV